MHQLTRKDYTTIPDINETVFVDEGHYDKICPKRKNRKSSNNNNNNYSLLYYSILFFCTAVGLGGFFLLKKQSLFDRIKSASHAHTVPTLLSVVDPETNILLFANDNELYDLLQHGIFSINNHHQHYQSKPQLLVNKTLLPSPTSTTDLLYLLDIPTTTTTTTKSVVRNDDIALTISWSDSVKDDDILILYCGDHILPSKELNPYDFLEAATIAQARATSKFHNNKNCTTTDNSWRIPRFPILRQSICQFRMFRYRSNFLDNKHPTFTTIAKSSIIHFESEETPSAIHLSVGDKSDTAMVVHFTTKGEQGYPVARFGTATSNYLNKVSTIVSSFSYTANDMCQAPANETGPGRFYPPGTIHVAEFSDLLPNTSYKYQVGTKLNNTHTIWSDEYIFHSAPKIGSVDSPMKILAYGDQGCPRFGWETLHCWITEMAQREADATSLHLIGDLTYSFGAAHIWDEWLRIIEPVTTVMSFMISVGNHEYCHKSGGKNGKDPSGVITDYCYMPPWGNYKDDSGGECGVPVANRFNMPQSILQGQKSNGVFWYSYQIGMVHFIVLSSEHDLTQKSRQYQWLMTNLALVDRTITPWLIIEIHRPLYEGGGDAVGRTKNRKVSQALRLELEDLFVFYQVDLILSGHFHEYHRTCDGLVNGTCTNNNNNNNIFVGPMHITIGTAGADLDTEAEIDEPWTAKYINGVYGYGRLNFYNATTLHFEFVTMGYDNYDYDSTNCNGGGGGEILDSVWIYRTRV